MAVPLLRRTLRCTFIVGILVLRTAFAEDAVPAPIALDSKEVAAFITLSDAKAVLTSLDAIAKKALPPEIYQPGMLQTLVGTKLGDPTLASVVPNKPLLAVVFKVPNGFDPKNGPPPMALYVPLTPDSPVLDLVKEQMKNDPTAQLAYDNGLLIIATTDFMDKAKTAESLYQKLAQAHLQSDARVYVSIAALMETFGPLIKTEFEQSRDGALNNLKNFPPPPEMGLSAETAGHVVRVFFKTVYGFLDQSDALQLDLKIKPDSIQIENLFAAKSGTLLADFFSGTPLAPNSKLESFLTKGFMTYVASYDAKALAAAVRKAIAEIAADPLTAPLAKNEVFVTLQQSLDASGGEAVSSLAAGANGPEVTQVYAVADEAKYIVLMERMTTWFGPDSIISKIYGQMGMKFDMKLEKSIREHAGAVIHRLKFSMDSQFMPPQEKERLKAFLPAYEVSTTKGYAVMASNPASLDAALDKIAKGEFPPSGVTLKSAAAFGKGKNVYADLDIVAYMKFVMTKMAPDPQAAQIFNQLKSNEPVLISYAHANGRAIAQINVPLMPILEMIKLFHALEAGPAKEPDTAKEKF